MILVKQTQTKNSKTTLGKFVRALFSKETPVYIKAIVGAAVAYTVFPLDVLPDFLGVVGLVDDAAILTVLTTIAMTLLDNHNNNDINETPETDRDFEEVN